MRGALLALLTIACGASQDPAPSRPAGPRKRSAGPPAGEELVRLHLLADVTRVAPGQELTVAARLDIEPGWHIYWSNPGESGLPTEVELVAPPGFQVGAVRYPGPNRFESPGEITSYG